MNIALNNGKAQAGTEHIPADDVAFAEALRAWIVDFHGGIKAYPADMMEQRIKSYLRQEDLYREKVRFILSLLPGRPMIGLDIGSSAGGLSVALAQAGVDMYGIEPSSAGVRASKMRAQRLGVENTTFVEGVGEKLSFPDEMFDLVVSLAVIEHVQDVNKVLEEAFRVLKPGGWLYLEVPNNLFPFEGHYKMAWFPMMPKPIAKRYVRARGAYPDFLDHLNYMSRFIIQRYLRMAGFAAIKDVYGEFLAGKAAGAPWADSSGRLARLPWSAHLVRQLCGPLPTAWFMNRAVFMIAAKPDNRNGH
jgi:ubiquinone/menaquinone biosynthesis C-methylase UbiE